MALSNGFCHCDIKEMNVGSAVAFVGPTVTCQCGDGLHNITASSGGKSKIFGGASSPPPPVLAAAGKSCHHDNLAYSFDTKYTRNKPIRDFDLNYFVLQEMSCFLFQVQRLCVMMAVYFYLSDALLWSYLPLHSFFTGGKPILYFFLFH